MKIARQFHRRKSVFDWLLLFTAALAGLGLAIFSGCVTQLPQERDITPATHRRVMDYWTGWYQRSYLVHVPPGYHARKPMPLVVVVHGGFDTAEGMEKFSGFSKLSDREGFVVLYPNGIGILGFLQHWNAGHCCGKAARDEIDDVAVVNAAIEDVCDHLRIDRSRIYMTGFSNGGMLTYRFAAEKGDVLAAAAPLAAAIGGRPSETSPEWKIPPPKVPLPILVFHGLADDMIPYAGGTSPHFGGTRTFFSVEDSVLFWVRRNGCNPKPEKQEFRNGCVHLQNWKGGKNGSCVQLCTVETWDHRWPGLYFTAHLPDDHPLKNFDAAELIWNFFKNHRRK